MADASPPTLDSAHERPVSPEQLERNAALKRGEGAVGGERERSEGGWGVSEPELARRAFVALADGVRDYAIFLMNPQGVITFWGHGAYLMKWWTREQAEGSHLRMLYPDFGSEDGTAEAHLDEAALQGEYTGEGQRIRGDGSTFWAGVTLTALRDERGELLGFAKVTRDLTARRAADTLLQSASAAAETARMEAEAASLAKSGFLATMSHEIRTPVNAILGYHELLEMQIAGELNDGQRRYLERAASSGRHLLALIDDVLDFSRMEAGRVAVRPTTVRIGSVITAALSLVTPQAETKKLKLIDASAGYASGLSVTGDEGRIRQILVNLLSNAVKFTESRGDAPGRITVSVGSATTASPEAQLAGDGPWVYVRVEDTGCGIPAGRREAVFEPFVQADMTHTRQYGGTGLGLAISRRLARLMNGDLTVRSEVGVGSSFFVWLPAAPLESLATGGVPGHGPTSDESSVPQTTLDSEPGLPSRVAQALLADLERILHAYVSRLRSDPGTPAARRISEPELEDHLATFLADIAGTLATFDVAGGGPDAASEDGTEIQRIIAERHGMQRARLGWSSSEVEREFAILQEELLAAVFRRLGSGQPSGRAEHERRQGQALLEPFVTRARELSLTRMRRALAEGMSSP